MPAQRRDGEGRVLESLRRFGRATNRQLAERLGLPQKSITTALRGLRKKGLVAQCDRDGQHAIWDIAKGGAGG